MCINIRVMYSYTDVDVRVVCCFFFESTHPTCPVVPEASRLPGIFFMVRIVKVSSLTTAFLDDDDDDDDDDTREDDGATTDGEGEGRRHRRRRAKRPAVVVVVVFTSSFQRLHSALI